MKYINIKTKMVWENDDAEWVAKLVETNDDFELFIEEEQPKEENELAGITAYIPKPRKNKK